MTGLSVVVKDRLQVAYYGIGGHYLPHLDFKKDAEITKIDKSSTGNPIVTVLFYVRVAMPFGSR